MKPPDIRNPAAVRTSPRSGGVMVSPRVVPFPSAVVTLRMGEYDSRIHLGFIRAAREMGWELREIREFSRNAATPWTLESAGRSVRLHPADAPHACDGQSLQVSLSYGAAGRLAADHLLGLRFPHLAFYHGSRQSGTGRLFTSFAEACREAGRTVIELAGPASGIAGDHDRFVMALGALPRPCAVLAASDEDAAALVNAANAIGIPIPGVLAVLGCGNHEVSLAKCGPQLSSVDLNHELAGYTTAKLFQHLLDGESPSGTRWAVKPGPLIERETTRACGVRHVISRIGRDFAEPLTVPQLAREAGLSVRTLQRLYQGLTGSSIGEDILNRRLEAASRMLGETDFKLEAVARMAGLSNANRLCRLFRIRFGCTPIQRRSQRESQSIRPTIPIPS